MSTPSLIARAEAYSESTAVRTSTAACSYAELLNRSAGFAGILLDGSTDLQQRRVACLVPPGVDYVVSQWAVWRAGGIFVPLSLSATEPELEYALTDAEASCVVVADELAERVSGLCERIGIRCIAVNPRHSIAEVDLPTVDSHRPAMILYTSGTTSRPKGVVTTHDNIEAQIASLVEAWKWEVADRIPLFLPLHHIHGIINILSCALWSGASVEMFRGFDTDAVLDQVSEREYSLFMAVPTIYVKLIRILNSCESERRDKIIAGFESMRLMVSGSAALPATVHEAWFQLTGQKLLERYGMTEIGMGLSNPYDGERRPGAVGQPLPRVDIRLKSEAGDVVDQEDQPGEIQVRGSGVFARYWNRSEATSAAFDDGWFKTGDIAVVEDGYYRIMGRQFVDIIKSGGYKLSALEIETTLLDHDSICECAVVGVMDDTWGEIVAAAVVLEAGAQLDLESLQAWCGERLSSYRLPRRLRVVDQLPRNAMGKVTKPDVRGLFQ